MTDYIFLKLSEMALRAIRAPKGPHLSDWKCRVTFRDLDGPWYYYYSELPLVTSRIPFIVTGPGMLMQFPEGTIEYDESNGFMAVVDDFVEGHVLDYL